MDEPAFVEVVVARCTSPVTSAYDESVAARLAHDIRARGQKFNIAAAHYAVDLAHSLAVVNVDNIWTSNGHLVNLVAKVRDRNWLDELPLTVDERLLHLRLFLESDGAALIFLANLFLKERQLPTPSLNWNSIACDMLLAVYSEYLLLTTLTADRMLLRSKIDRLRARGFKGKSGPHQTFLHLQTLHRLGLIDRILQSKERRYRISDEGDERLRRLVEALPNILALEQAVKEHRYIEVAARVYDLRNQTIDLTPQDALRWLIPSYRRIAETGVAICPLPPILEATQIALLSKESRFVGYADLIELLHQAQALHLRDIRFHQDRHGNPAFLKISDDLINQIAPDP